MTLKTPLADGRHAKPFDSRPGQTELAQQTRRRISSPANESIQDLQQQITELVCEQRRMAAAIKQLTRYLCLTNDETLAHADNRDESELPLWTACGIAIDKVSGNGADAEPTPGAPSGRRNTSGRPENIDSFQGMEPAPHEPSPPSRTEEELVLDFFPNGGPRPAGKAKPDGPDDEGPTTNIPAKATIELSDSAQHNSEETQDPSADGVPPQDPIPDRVGSQDTGIDESTLTPGVEPADNSVFFPPKSDSRPAARRFTGVLTAVVLLTATFWFGRQVMRPRPVPTPKRPTAAAPAPVFSKAFLQISPPQEPPEPPPQSTPAPAPNTGPAAPAAPAPHPMGETGPEPVSVSARDLEPSPPEAGDPYRVTTGAALTAPTPVQKATPRNTAVKAPTRLPRYPYAILIASVRTSAQANRAVAQYRQAGLSPYWTEVDLKERGVWYRIFSGHFETAEAARQRIEEMGLSGALTKHTRWVASVGTYEENKAGAVCRRLAEETPWMPYVIEIDERRHSVCVGAFYTETGADRQCEMLKDRGIDCVVGER